MRNLMLSVLLLCSLALANTGWRWNSPVPSGNPINDICLVGDSDAWIVTDFGEIYHAAKTGTVWTFENQYMSNSGNDLFGIFFLDANTGWAVGGATSTDLMLKTTNGGATWSVISEKQFYPMLDVCFIDASTGWAAGKGGKILHTTNGGTDWTEQTSGVTKTLRTVQFVSATKGWVVGGTSILYTSDGGTNWTEQKSSSPRGMYGIHMLDENTGWAVGGGSYQSIVYHTTNGGADWTDQTAGVTTTLYDVFFLDANTGWISGAEGKILGTVNGGTDWSEQESLSKMELNAICFASATDGICVGGWINGNERIGSLVYTSTNGGTNWTIHNIYETANLSTYSDVCFADADNGWVVSSTGPSVRTTDGGATWAPMTMNAANGGFKRVVFTDADTGYAAGSLMGIMPVMEKTTDGGATWTNVTPPAGMTDITDITFVNGTTGWLAGVGATGPSTSVYKTTDGGANWTAQTPDGTTMFQCVYFLDKNTGWAGSLMTTVFRTDNGGDTWTEQTMAGSSPLMRIFFSDANTGWAAGTSLFRTADGGTTWEQTHNGTMPFGGLYSPDGQHVWVSGYQQILYSSDAGANWDVQFGGTYSQLAGVFFADANNGWVVGPYNTILHTTTGGVSGIRTAPGIERAQLRPGVRFACAPHPFQGEAVITLGLDEDAEVGLDLYTTDGRCVQSLSAGRLAKGEHSFAIGEAWDDSGVVLAVITLNGTAYYRTIVRQ